MKIILSCVCPPIPDRSHDWCAYDDSTYDGPGSAIGWGATAREAIDDLEDLFVRMQGEVWSPQGEMNGFLRGLGLAHTSMSIGDVAHDNATGQYWAVAPMGFKQIGEV
jgi:hypothetical protein